MIGSMGLSIGKSVAELPSAKVSLSRTCGVGVSSLEISGTILRHPLRKETASSTAHPNCVSSGTGWAKFYMD